MPINLSCDECFTPLAVPEKYAGKKIKCKSCGAAVIVPAAKQKPAAEADDFGDLLEGSLESAEADSGEPLPSRPKSKGKGKAGKKQQPARAMPGWYNPQIIQWGLLVIYLLSMAVAGLAKVVVIFAVWMGVAGLMVVAGLFWAFVQLLTRGNVQANWITLLTFPLAPFTGFYLVNRSAMERTAHQDLGETAKKLIVFGILLGLTTLILGGIIAAMIGPNPE